MYKKQIQIYLQLFLFKFTNGIKILNIILPIMIH